MDEQQILDHLWVVRKIASWYYSRNKLLPYDQLYQEGCMGLLEAGNRYREGSPAAFSTFAHHRVRGSIRDAYRKEMCQGFVGRARKIRRGAPPVEIECLNEPRFSDADGPSILWEETIGSDGMLDRLCAKDLLGRLLAGLSPRQLLVVDLRFFQDHTLREVGAVLGVTESRAHQLVKETLIRLHLILEKEEQDDDHLRC